MSMELPNRGTWAVDPYPLSSDADLSLHVQAVCACTFGASDRNDLGYGPFDVTNASKHLIKFRSTIGVVSLKKLTNHIRI